MNNEPVAWIDKITGKPRMDGFVQTNYDIPLYLHPAKDNYRETHEGFSTVLDAIHPAKTLTDEEIWAIASEIEPVDLQWGVRLSNKLNVLDFARAILRKVNEK